MPTAPRNPQASSLILKRPTWSVRLQQSDGGDVTPSSEVSYLVPLTVEIGAGVEGLPRARFGYDLAARNERIMDVETPTSYSRQVRIVEISASGATSRGIFCGEIEVQSLELTDQGESVEVEAQLAPFHFGTKLHGPRVADAEGNPFDLQTPLVFNPEIDGKICPNLDDSTDLTAGSSTYHPWVDPESTRTSVARSIANVSVASWTLDQIVNTLCSMLNPDQTYLKNPQLKDLQSVFTNAPAVKNLHVKPGHYLPELLDAVLKAYGYYWTLIPLDGTSNDDSSNPFYTLKIFKLGEGTEKTLNFQRPSEDLDLTKSDTPDVRTETSISEMANVVVGHGALLEREVTMELYRAWPEDQDSRDVADLDRDGDGDHKTDAVTWRLWVGNEAGDYCGLRTGVAPIPSMPTNLSSVFTLPEDEDEVTVIPRRRRFFDCLTYTTDAVNVRSGDVPTRRRRPLIEWWTVDDEWAEVPSEWGARVIEHQCAVYFDAPRPPAELIDRGSDARIRVTATIVGDTRIEFSTDRSVSSPQGRDVELFLDLADRFFDRAVVTTGDFASSLAGGTYGADERDDSAELIKFVKEIQAIEDAALMRASLTFYGLTTSLGVGDLVTKVNGRNISFNRKSKDATTKLYPQVFGIVREYQKMRTFFRVRAAEDAQLKAEIKLAGFREARHGRK